jgi:hypothetical protein
MRIDQAVNIEDLHRTAKQRLPEIAFDFIEGGREDERGLQRNTSAFHKHYLLPRYYSSPLTGTRRIRMRASSSTTRALQRLFSCSQIGEKHSGLLLRRPVLHLSEEDQ